MQYLRNQHGTALLGAFRAEPRNAPFLGWIADAEGRPLDETAAAAAVFERYREVDPTRNGACLQWLLRLAIAGDLPAEDLPKARQTLQAFQIYKRRLPADQRDLGRYGSLGDVWDAVRPLVQANAATSRADDERRERQAVLAESTVLLPADDSGGTGWIVAIPNTKRASNWWGRGTRWCTAGGGHNYFDIYNNNGPLVVFVRPDGEKFQFHAHSGQFMDAADRRARFDVIPKEVRRALRRRAPGLDLVLELIEKAGSGRGISDLPQRQVNVGFLKRLFQYAVDRRRAETTRWASAVRDFRLPLTMVPKHLLGATVYRAAVQVDGRLLHDVPERFRTRDLVLDALRSEGVMILHQSAPDREMFLAAVQGGFSLSNVPDSIRDREICLNAVRKLPIALRSVPAPHNHDREILFTAVSGEGRLLRTVPPAMIDYEMAVVAVRNHAYLLHDVPEHLRDAALCREALSRDVDVLPAVPQRVLDREMCLTAVQEAGMMLEYVPDAWRDVEMCHTAYKADPRAILYMPPSLVTHEMVLRTVSWYPEISGKIPEHLLGAEIWSKVVDAQPGNIRWVPPNMIDRGMAEVAVRADAAHIHHVPDAVADDALCDLAIDKDPRLFTALPVAMQTEERLLRAVARNPFVLESIPVRQRSLMACIEALVRDSNVITRIPESLQHRVQQAVQERALERALASKQNAHPSSAPPLSVSNGPALIAVKAGWIQGDEIPAEGIDYSGPCPG